MTQVYAVLGEVGYQPLIVLAITASAVAAGIFGLQFRLRRLVKRYRARCTQLLAAMDQMDEGVILFTDKRKVIFCNRRYREIYGFTEEQLRVCPKELPVFL